MTRASHIVRSENDYSIPNITVTLQLLYDCASLTCLLMEDDRSQA